MDTRCIARSIRMLLVHNNAPGLDRNTALNTTTFFMNDRLDQVFIADSVSHGHLFIF